MRAYGVPRLSGVEFPDKGDIKEFGLSTKDRCSKTDRGKNSTRRIWKKKFRAKQKQELIIN